jgi:DNA repair protein RecO (recombination protein O)
MQQKSRAIVLRRVAFGEADWIVTLFTRDAGRISGIARSARASQRRFGGALELGSIVDVRYSERGNASFVRLEEAAVAVPTIGAMKSLARIGAVARSLCLALAFLPEREANPEKFDLLVRRIQALCEDDPKSADGLSFELEWLARCGFGPTVVCCASCGASAARGGRWSFEFDRGGIVCGSCSAMHAARVSLSEEARRGFVALADGGVPAEPAHADAATAVLGRYIDHIVGHPLGVR